MSETFAIIATGGKQVLVRPGASVRVETLPGEPGTAVAFDDVLLIANGDDVRVGTPRVLGASVSGTIARHGRGKKVVGVKFKAKKRYRRKFGHRQRFTDVRIEEIRT